MRNPPHDPATTLCPSWDTDGAAISAHSGIIVKEEGKHRSK